MDQHKCPFCQHDNPADSKYCSDCGGCLYLVPCASCGAINDVKASVCYQCQAHLQPGSTDTLAHPSPLAVVAPAREADILTRALEVGTLEPPVTVAPVAAATPFWRRYRSAGVLAGTAALVAIAGMGYYSYRHQVPSAATQAPAAGGEARARVTPANAGTIRSEPAASSAQGKAAAAVAAPTAAVAAVPAPEASAAVAAVNPPANNTGAAATPRSNACTDASAALGLCDVAPAEATVPAVTHTQKKE